MNLRIEKESVLFKCFTKLDYKYYPILAFFITCIVYLSALSISGVLGNGIYLLEIGDLKIQYIPFIMQMGEVIKGNHSFWYSWNIGLGSGSVGSYAYSALSPFNMFYWILGEKYLHVASALVIILKSATAALSFQIFISKYLRHIYFETILFSMMYGLNGFIVAYYHTPIFMDAVLVFPLIMLGIISLIRHGKTFTLMLSYIYLIGTSLYMGYVIGICSFIIFIYVYLYSRTYKSHKENLLIIFKYFESVLLALGITAFIWVPAALNMWELKNNFAPYSKIQKCNIILIINNLFMGQYQGVDGFVPYIYCGVLAILSFPLFVTNKHINKRKKIYIISCIFTFVLFIIVPQLSYVLHCFDEPNATRYRFSFVLCFLLLSVQSLQFPYVIGINAIKRKFLYGLTGTYIIIQFVSSYMIKSKWGISNSNTIFNAILNIFIILLLYFILKEYKNRKLDTFTKRTLFSTIIVIELVMNVFVIQRSIGSQITVMDDEFYTTTEKNTIKLLKEDKKKFIRTIYQDDYNVDVALEHDIPSLSIFTSLFSDRLIDFLKKTGFEYRANVITGSGWTPVTTSLMGIDYIVDGDNIKSDDPTVIVLPEANEHYYQNYIKNDRSLPIAYMVSMDVMNYKYGNSVFENQDNLLSMMTGHPVNCYKPIEMYIPNENVLVQKSRDGEIIINDNYPNEDKDVIFIGKKVTAKPVYVNFFSEKEVYRDSVYSEGPVFESYYDNYMYYTRIPHMYPSQLFRIGTSDEGRPQFKMKINSKINEVSYKKGYFVEYNEKVFDEVYRELNDNSMTIKDLDDGFISGSVNCNKDCILFTSIPYEKGWHAYVDGYETEVLPIVENTFVGVKLISGFHNIVLEYRAPGKNIGQIISIVTLAIVFILYIITKSYVRNKK